MTVRGAYRRLTTLLFLPAKVVEEALHAAAIYPWAERIGIWIEPSSGTAGVDAVAPNAPDWGLWLTRRAPQIAGVVLGVAAIVAVASGVRPERPIDLVTALCLAFWWVKLVAPERQPDHDTEATHGN